MKKQRLMRILSKLFRMINPMKKFVFFSLKKDATISCSAKTRLATAVAGQAQTGRTSLGKISFLDKSKHRRWSCRLSRSFCVCFSTGKPARRLRRFYIFPSQSLIPQRTPLRRETGSANRGRAASLVLRPLADLGYTAHIRLQYGRDRHRTVFALIVF